MYSKKLPAEAKVSGSLEEESCSWFDCDASDGLEESNGALNSSMVGNARPESILNVLEDFGGRFAWSFGSNGLHGGDLRGRGLDVVCICVAVVWSGSFRGGSWNL